MVYDFSNLDLDECKSLIALARARIHTLIAQNPTVYAIKKTDARYGTRYHTCVPGKGWRQMMAWRMDDYFLWVAAGYEWADEMRAAMQRANPKAQYELVEIEKRLLPSMNCWPRYKDQEIFQTDLTADGS